MKVWHLLSNRWNSAITEYAISFVKSLHLLGHESIITGVVGSAASKRINKENIPSEMIGKFDLSSLKALLKIKNKHNPSFIVVYGGPEEFLCHLLFPNTTKIRFRGASLGKCSGFKKQMIRWNSRRSHLVLTPNTRLKKEIEAYLPSKRTNVESITLGLPWSYSPVAVNRKEKVRPEILVFGRIDPVKGHREFLEVFKSLLEIWDPQFPTPMLRIVGEEANLTLENIDSLRNDLKIPQENVSFCNKRILNVTELLSSVTLGVVCSIGSEIIGRVGEEFLLAGTPLFASSVGGLAEIVEEEKYLFSWSEGSNSIALRLRECLELSWCESQNCRIQRSNKALKQYSLPAMASKIDEVLFSNAFIE